MVKEVWLNDWLTDWPSQLTLWGLRFDSCSRHLSFVTRLYTQHCRARELNSWHFGCNGPNFFIFVYIAKFSYSLIEIPLAQWLACKTFIPKVLSSNLGKFSIKFTFSFNLMIWLCDIQTDIHTYRKWLLNVLSDVKNLSLQSNCLIL